MVLETVCPRQIFLEKQVLPNVSWEGKLLCLFVLSRGCGTL